MRPSCPRAVKRNVRDIIYTLQRGHQVGLNLRFLHFLDADSTRINHASHRSVLLRNLGNASHPKDGNRSRRRFARSRISRSGRSLCNLVTCRLGRRLEANRSRLVQWGQGCCRIRSLDVGPYADVQASRGVRSALDAANYRTPYRIVGKGLYLTTRSNR